MYLLMRILGFIFSRLSPSTLESIAAFLSWLWFDVFRFRRALILENLQRAFGEQMSNAERLRVGRQSVRHLILVFLEFFYSERHDIAADMRWEGRENLDAALKKGQGAYVLCCHIGNWEAMGARYNRDVVPTYVIIKKLAIGGMNRYMEEGRKRNGFRVILREKKGDAFRQIGDVLQSGGVVGFVMDQARPGSPKLPFFGQPAKTNTSFAGIWRRAPAPILPGFAIRTGFNQHTLYVWPELTVEKTDDEATDVMRHSAQFNACVEAIVRQCPEQYLWMHNRWK